MGDEDRNNFFGNRVEYYCTFGENLSLLWQVSKN